MVQVDVVVQDVCLEKWLLVILVQGTTANAAWLQHVNLRVAPVDPQDLVVRVRRHVAMAKPCQGTFVEGETVTAVFHQHV